jgi:hypothetical protein
MVYPLSTPSQPSIKLRQGAEPPATMPPSATSEEAFVDPSLIGTPADVNGDSFTPTDTTLAPAGDVEAPQTLDEDGNPLQTLDEDGNPINFDTEGEGKDDAPQGFMGKTKAFLKKPVGIATAIVLTALAVAGVYFGFIHEKDAASLVAKKGRDAAVDLKNGLEKAGVDDATAGVKKATKDIEESMTNDAAAAAKTAETEAAPSVEPALDLDEESAPKTTEEASQKKGFFKEKWHWFTGAFNGTVGKLWRRLRN